MNLRRLNELDDEKRLNDEKRLDDEKRIFFNDITRT